MALALRVVAGLGLIALGGAYVMAQDTKKGKPNLPAAVSQAMEANRPGAEIAKIDVEKENGISFYDIEFKGNQGEMDVAQDGTVLDIATIIEMKDVPEAAAAAIRSHAKGKTIKQLSRSEVRAEIVKEGGKARVSRLAVPRYVYEAEFSSGEIEVAPDGKIIKIGK
jgi:hypothetical protein